MQPFVGVEYKLPWETSEKEINGLCLPCLRAATQLLFFDIMQNGTKIDRVIQRFYNLHSVPGEYNLACMLVCPPNGPIASLPMPVMRHQRNFYKVINNSGVFFMQQVGVDFCQGPCL